MEKTLAKVKKATEIPSIAELQAKTNAIKVASKGIEKATNGAKEAAAEQEAIAESKEDPVETVEAEPEAKDAPAAKTAVKQAKKKSKAKLNPSVAFKNDVMEQASKVLNDQIVNNIAISSEKTDKNGNRICKKGEDEAFDNCVVAAEKDQDAEDEEDIKTANQQMGTREYRDANLDLLARSQPTEIHAISSTDCCGTTHTTISVCKCPEPPIPEKPKPAPEKPAAEKAVEVAVKVVEKAQKKEEAILKKVEVAKARQPNGIIDLVSQVLSENAKKQAEKDSNRQRLQAAIMTNAAAFSAKSSATRSSLESGFEATKELDKPNAKDTKLQSSFNEKLEALKKEVTYAGSGPTVPTDVSDELEKSPITEKAAATLEENKKEIEAMNKDQ